MDVSYFVRTSCSLREAWRRYCEYYPPVAWDTFRKWSKSILAKQEESVTTTSSSSFTITVPDKEPEYKVGLALYDLHFPHESDEVLKTVVDYVSEEFPKLDYFILGGDVLDCAAISKFGNDPFDTKPIHQELEYASDRLKELVDDIGADKTYYIKGNHEDRLDRYLQTRAPEISRLKGLTVQDQLGLSEIGVEWVDNIKRKADGQGFFKIGKLYFLHGHELGICPMVAPARRYFLKAFANVMCGHIHRVDEHFERTIDESLIGSWTCGCACDLTPAYRSHNSWVQGFAVIKWYPDGLFHVDLKKIINSKVL